MLTKVRGLGKMNGKEVTELSIICFFHISVLWYFVALYCLFTMTESNSPDHTLLPNEIQVLKNNNGISIFYATSQCLGHTMLPHLHIKEFTGDVPIQNSSEEINFLLRCPTLVLQKRKSFYYPTYHSLKTFMSCVRFDENGIIKLVHPKVVFNVCKIYMKTKDLLKNSRMDHVYEGPYSFVAIKKAESYNVRTTVCIPLLFAKPLHTFKTLYKNVSTVCTNSNSNSNFSAICKAF